MLAVAYLIHLIRAKRHNKHTLVEKIVGIYARPLKHASLLPRRMVIGRVVFKLAPFVVGGICL